MSAVGEENVIIKYVGCWATQESNFSKIYFHVSLSTKNKLTVIINVQVNSNNSTDTNILIILADRFSAYQATFGVA